MHVRVLSRHPQCEFARRVVEVGQRGSWLDGMGDQALIPEIDLRRVDGARESLLGRVLVADLEVEGDVVRSLLMDLSGAVLRRGPDVDRHLERLVVDRHQIGGIASRIAIRRNHDRHRVTHVAHRVVGENRVQRLLEIGQ